MSRAFWKNQYVKNTIHEQLLTKGDTVAVFETNDGRVE